MAKGMIHNKAPFLDHVAKTLGRKRIEGKVDKPIWSVQPQWDVLKGFSQDDLVYVLKEQCKNIHTEFHHTTKAELADTLFKIIMDVGGESVVLSDDMRFDLYGLGDLFDHRLHKELVSVHKWASDEDRENIEKSKNANIGITFSDVTLAESGTIVLFNNKGNGRSISLLPAVYIGIIEKSKIVPRMTQAANHIEEEFGDGVGVPSCVSFITGPSNSADIEMNLIVGVHGPVKAVYVVVED